jgi:O-antigen ligase/Tfp pilus assembly protein PilF
MKKIALWVTSISLFAIPFLALLVPNGFFFPFITGKNFGFRILVEIAFAFWLALIAMDASYRPKLSWTMVTYGFFTAWIFIADLLAVNSHKALWSNFERMDGFVSLIHVFIFFVIAGSLFAKENLWRAWWGTFVGASVLVSLNGLSQLAGKADIHQGSTRIDATLGNSEYLAGFLLFGIAMTIWLAYETKKTTWLRYLLYGIGILQLVVLFQTGTRGTFIALVAALGIGAVLLLLNASKLGEQGKRVQKFGIGLLLLVVMLVGGLFALRNSPVVTENVNLQRLASTFSLKKELGTRLTIWSMGIEGVQEKPLHGWGQEGYNYVFNQYYRPSLYAQEAWFDRAHNLFIDWLVAGGIPALLLFIAFLSSAFIAYLRNKEYSWTTRTIFVSALAAYCIQGLVVFDNLFTYIPLAMLLAMAHSGSLWHTMEKTGNSKKNTAGAYETLEATSTSAVWTSMVSAFFGAIILIWTINVPTLSASSDLISALTPTNSGDPLVQLGYFKKALTDGGFASQEVNEQLLQFASNKASDTSLSVEQKTEIVQTAITEMTKQIAHAPSDARLRLQFAVLLRTVGKYDEAMVQSQIAHTLSPQKQAIIQEQGIESLQAGDPQKAKEFFAQAFALDESNSAAAAYLAGGHIFAGEVPQAKKLLQAQFGTTTVTENILIIAYYQTKNWEDLILLLQKKLIEQNDATTGIELAATYAQAGRYAEARGQLEETKTQHPEASAQASQMLQQLQNARK